jgi:predicted alpha/beta superfamily hydrolase
MKKLSLLALGSLMMLSCGQTEPKSEKHALQNEKASTAQQNIQVLDTAFYMPQLERYRRLWIYLPPDYETSGREYPVFYMHDGQNLFDDQTSYVGEWGVDETLNAMSADGFTGIIVVGIDHGSHERLNEYSPWKREDWGGGLGDKYAAFLVETLKPFIDSEFRTLSDREHTGIGGSSMGGLISLYATLKYPEVFSRSLIFSPAFWFSEQSYEFSVKAKIEDEFRLYFLAGGKEYGDRDVPLSTERMVNILKANGLGENQYRFVVDEEGLHNEGFWKKYFSDAVLFLFSE